MQYKSMNMREQDQSGDMVPEQGQIGFKKIKIQAQITAQFEIK
jgi:hypothetical protein